MQSLNKFVMEKLTQDKTPHHVDVHDPLTDGSEVSASPMMRYVSPVNVLFEI